MESFLGAAVMVLILVGSTGAQYEDCARNKLTLLKALYETGDNLYQLDKVFFPQRSVSSRYVIVKYTFLDKNSTSEYYDADIKNCTVTYIWALGGFLLEQPPTLLQYTSLLFNVPVNNVWDLELTLPYPCRALLPVHDDNGNCMCTDNRTHVAGTALGRFTQQVLLFAVVVACCCYFIADPAWHTDFPSKACTP